MVITSDYRGVLSACYKQDSELVEKYHVLAPTNLEKAIDHTANIFESSEGFEMHVVYEQGDLLGYFGRQVTDIEVLKGFFIMPAFRNKEGVRIFWNYVYKIFAPDIYTCIYENNIRAEQFLLREKFIFVRRVFDQKEQRNYNIYLKCHSEDY